MYGQYSGALVLYSMRPGGGVQACCMYCTCLVYSALCQYSGIFTWVTGIGIDSAGLLVMAALLYATMPLLVQWSGS